MKWRFGVAVMAILLTLVAATAVWAQGNTGTISGKVLDDKGQAIPGAVVTVTSTYLQGPRGTATNLDGEYVVPYLPPGNDYKIAIEAAGFNKVIQSNVTVNLGGTTTMQTTLVSGGTEVQVTARPPAVSLKEIKVSTNLTQEELETLPISRAYQDTLLLAPTVVSSGSGGNPGVAGSTSSENVFLINGVNTTDPVTGTFGTNLNYNFIREMEVNTGGLDAEYGASTGGLFNVLTKSGTNEYHGEVFAYYQDQSFNANQHSTDLSVTKPQPFHNYDYGFDLGGPIIKDKLWFFVGYNPSLYTQHYEGTSVITNVNPYSPNVGKTSGIPYKYDNLSRNWFMSAKFNYRVNDKHNLELAVFADPSHMWYNEGASFPSYPTIDNRSYQTRRYQGGYNAALRWYATWNSKFFSEVSVGKTHSILQILPWDNSGYGMKQFLSYDTSPTVSVGSGTGTALWDNRDSFQMNAKGTYLLGRHEIKAGVDWEDIKWFGFNGYTGGQQLAGQFNLKNPANTFDPNLNDYYYQYVSWLQNPSYDEKGRYVAAFLQDKWSVTDYFGIAAGVRFERNEVLPKNGQDLKLDSWSPRLGLTWDWAKNGKSKFYANYGLYYERTPIAMAQSMDAGHASYQTIYKKYGTGIYGKYAYGTTPTIVAPDVKNQYNTEFLIGNQYELRPDLTLDVRAVFRSLGRVLEDVGYIDPTNSSGISYVIMNPGSGTWPAYMSQWSKNIPYYEQFPRPIRNYQGYTISLMKRYSNRWFMNANYTWSRLQGNYEGGSGGYSNAGLNPNASSAYDIPSHLLINNYYGLLPQDRTHQIKVQGSYKFDFGLVLGTNFTLSTGRPEDQKYGYPSRELGYGTILAVPRGSAGRMPTTWTLDVHAEYAFKIWKSSLSLFADIFNITNNQSQTAYYSTYYVTPGTWKDLNTLQRDPNWGKTTARQASRNARVGLRWSF